MKRTFANVGIDEIPDLWRDPYFRMVDAAIAVNQAHEKLVESQEAFVRLMEKVPAPKTIKAPTKTKKKK